MSSRDVLLQSISMILVSETLDKTFLLAAVLAMRHPRMTVFLGAFSALILMTTLSAALGRILPAIIPQVYTQALAGLLFLVFGAKMVLEAREIKDGMEDVDKEMREVEGEIGLELDAHGSRQREMDRASIQRLEEGSLQEPEAVSWATSVRTIFSSAIGPVFMKTFALTFIAEWGDRSQIATIALGAAHNVYIVALGTILGHACCSALAVLCGRYLATKISLKHVTGGGACLFLIFGLYYLYTSITQIVAMGDLRKGAGIIAT